MTCKKTIPIGVKIIYNLVKIMSYIIQKMLLIIFARTVRAFQRSDIRAGMRGITLRTLLTFSALSCDDTLPNHGREHLLELVELCILFHDGASAFGRLKYLGVAQF